MPTPYRQGAGKVEMTTEQKRARVRELDARLNAGGLSAKENTELVKELNLLRKALRKRNTVTRKV